MPIERPPSGSLLEPDEPAPVEALRTQADSPFVLVADHAGLLLPRALGDLGVPEAERRRHIGWDIGIAAVARALSAQLDAPCVMQRYSRLVVDCNRDPAVPGSMPVLSEATAIPANRHLDDAERQARLDTLFHPYHDRIAALLDARADRGQRSVLVALHSFTPSYLGLARPMHAAAMHHRNPRLSHAFLALLRAEGDLVVGDNEPYAVSDATDYTVPVHAYRRGLDYLEIEIRQDLLGDAAGQAAWTARLARLLPQALAAIG